MLLHASIKYEWSHLNFWKPFLCPTCSCSRKIQNTSLYAQLERQSIKILDHIKKKKSHPPLFMFNNLEICLDIPWRMLIFWLSKPYNYDLQYFHLQMRMHFAKGSWWYYLKIVIFDNTWVIYMKENSNYRT